jgi:hypothetical protein
MLNAHTMYLTTAQPFAGFQLQPRVNCTLEKGNGVQNCHNRGGKGESTIHIMFNLKR